MFEHVLILITPSGGLFVGKAKEMVCPVRRTNLVVVFGRGSVKLEGDLRGRGLFTLTPVLSPQGRGRLRVQTGYIVYKLDRAHGLQFRARRTFQCPGKRPVPWMNESNLSQSNCGKRVL
jgi:hypothetical protein